MKKNIILCFSLLVVNGACAADKIRDVNIRGELAQIEALQKTLQQRRESLQNQLNDGVQSTEATPAAAHSASRVLENSGTVQERLKKLLAQKNEAVDAADDTTLTRAERKDAKLRADLTQNQLEKELLKAGVKKNFILIRDIQKSLPDAQLQRGAIGKVEFFADKRLNKKGSLKYEVFQNTAGGIDALVELNKTGTGSFIKLPLNGSGQSVFMQFMHEGDSIGTGKQFTLLHSEEMFANSPVELAEVKKGSSVFEGVLVPAS